MRIPASASLLLPLLMAGAAHANEESHSGLGQGGDNLPTVVVEAERLSGPSVSETGAAVYGVAAEDIERFPTGAQTPITDVLAQMPSVAIDQNQQIHIRNTEGPQFQYQINGFLVPLDINTNPPFISMLNTLFVDRLDLRVGVLPARYGYATGGVIDVESKDGCRQPGGEFSIFGGQRGTISPSLEYAAREGALASYVSARETWSNTAFSSATPGPTPIHDWQKSEQALGFWTYSLNQDTRLSLLLAATVSDNELPNAPGLAPAYSLAGVASIPSSADIDSSLNFRDYLLMGSIKSAPSSGLDLQLGYTAHFISQQFNPDSVGELIYQGVASQASHEDRDNAIEGDLRYASGAHTIGAGFYVGAYKVQSTDNSLVFPAGSSGQQTSNMPVRVLTGSSATKLHAGFARYLQVPSFLGIALNTPSAFAGTTAAGPPGATLPLAEDDYEYDAGGVVNATERLTLSVDSYYERTIRYLDTGQFGVVPIFAPFNYGLLNVLDRVNQIRSAQGIGIFQAAYAPRRILYGTVTFRF
jgi:hypothetical protein